jgi:hypothetical protein
VKYSLTVFDSIFDNKTSKRLDFETWNDFEQLLYRLAKMPGYKAKKGEKKKSSSLISPAIYQPNSTRANSNVTAWASWAALDVDNIDKPFDEVLQQYRSYYFVCYSTASSTVEKPKFRLVFPLTHHVQAENIRHFWYALNKQFNSIGDEQTKDLSRMYYVPAQYPNAHNFIFTNAGKFIDPYELMAFHPYVQKQSNSILDGLPQHMRDALLEARKERMTNRDIRWSSYRDCPFLNKKLLNEYRSISGIDGSGRYRMIYKLMTSIACNAIKRKYPITAKQISTLIRELDNDTARIYQRRPLDVEADRAIEYAYKNADS